MGDVIRVLYVDDSSFDRELVRDALAEHGGFLLTEAASQAEFDATVERENYDVVLTDFSILGFDGLEILDAIRSRNPAVPVVMVTGTGSEQVAVEAMKRGVMDYVIKSPNRIQILPHTIRSAIARKRLEEDRRRKNEELIAAATQWHATIDAIIDQVHLLDADGRIVRCNRAALDRLGKGQEEVVGRTIQELLPELAEPPDGWPIERIRRSLKRETHIRQQGGRWLFVAVDPVLDANGALVGAVRIVADITKRKEAEDARARLTAVLEATPDFVGTADADGRLRYLNKAARTVMGLGEHEPLGEGNFRDLHPEWAQGTLLHEAIRATFRQGTWSGEAVIRSTVGRDIPVSMAMVAHKRDDGTVEYVSSIARDITEQKRSEEALRNALASLQRTMERAVQAMALIVECRDPYTAGHQRRVAELSGAIANELGLSSEHLDMVRLAATVHDIGKINVPSEILSKPGRISEIEYDLIKGHSQVAYDILKTIDFPWPIAEIVLHHHERIDGSGYPMGLKGEEIPLESRIIAVADAVEAMASHRPYRPALGVEEALRTISAQRGKSYDPDVVDACLRLLANGTFAFGSGDIEGSLIWSD